MEAAGVELSRRVIGNTVTARDFWDKRLVPEDLAASFHFSGVRRSARVSTAVVETFWRGGGGVVTAQVTASLP